MSLPLHMSPEELQPYADLWHYHLDQVLAQLLHCYYTPNSELSTSKCPGGCVHPSLALAGLPAPPQVSPNELTSALQQALTAAQAQHLRHPHTMQLHPQPSNGASHGNGSGAQSGLLRQFEEAAATVSGVKPGYLMEGGWCHSRLCTVCVRAMYFLCDLVIQESRACTPEFMP
jgi:hypothetical protein